MHDDRIVVPRLQFRSRGGQSEILPGIDRIVRLFEETKTGPWSALQFLTEPDPNLGTTPIAALRAGQVAAVEHAARAVATCRAIINRSRRSFVRARAGSSSP